MSPIRERANGPPGSGMPDTSTLPEVGLSSPASTRRSVVFPAPFGPKTARHSPGASENVTPATAFLDPNARVSSEASTMGAAVEEVVDGLDVFIRLELAPLARAAQNGISLRLPPAELDQRLRHND